MGTRYLSFVVGGVAVAVALASVVLLHRPVHPTPPQVPTLPTPTSLDQQWRVLCQTGGCLTGGQDWSPLGGNEGCVLDTAPWKAFLTSPRERVVPFLLQRLDTRRKTAVHTCPYQATREDELAVYALQHVLHTNYPCRNQRTLWQRLENQGQRDQIKRFFRAVTHTAKLAYLDIHPDPSATTSPAPATLSTLAQQLFHSLRIYDTKGRETVE